MIDILVIVGIVAVVVIAIAPALIDKEWGLELTAILGYLGVIAIIMLVMIGITS